MKMEFNEMLRLSLLLCIFQFLDASPLNTNSANANCTDFKQQQIAPGVRFIPAGYGCTSCVCMNGGPEMCLAMLCQFPCPNYVTVDDKCCEFVCFDGPNREGTGSIGTVPPSNVTIFETDDSVTISTNNIGLRLVASTVTSFLILALLLFMIHRLRQRRLLLTLRRLNGRQLSGGYGARRFSYDEDGSVGYLTGRDQIDAGVYEDPPPPYTFWKPPESYFPQEEAPPPYERFNTNNSNFQSQMDCVIATSLPPYVTAAVQNDSHVTYPAYYFSTVNSFSVPTADEELTSNTNNFQMNNLDLESQDRRSRHSVPRQELNVVGSLSSLTSSQSDLNESQSVTRTSDSTDVVIRSDATYEDLHPSSERMPPLSIDVQMRGGGRNKNFYEQRNLKCHSCSDVVVENWQQSSNSVKRRSLQTGMKMCPDPTKWNLDASESSSSSSPTFDRTTMSPTSSDSSSICGDFNFESDVTNLKSVRGAVTNRDCSAGAASSISLLPSSAKRGKCGANVSQSDEKKNRKSASKLRQILESFNANNTMLKKISLKDKKGLGHVDRHSTDGDAQIEAKNVSLPSTNSTSIDNTSRTPRISYVGEGDILKNSVPEMRGATALENQTVGKLKSRPHSYDFGDLNTKGACAADLEGAPDPDQPHEYLLNSLDSFTCTCSSRASFGSEMLVLSSSTYPSQEGLALSPELQRCSSMVAEPSSSPDNFDESFTADGEWNIKHKQESPTARNPILKRSKCEDRDELTTVNGEIGASTSQQSNNLRINSFKSKHESYI